ncbi:hypothetical protein Pint_32999 [Pistacia integerrima]|uniref:Uncharacterized protein n=1 Tax=Pistacia integerrima TaxID=434235 RepID=A0ACC0X6E2_9ROSI|nr:hypothetical protein Pint_32999 [Pistacia integerrima]
MVRGYGNDMSWTFQATTIFLAQMGFACFVLDIESHGRSPNCSSFFNSVKRGPSFNVLPRFLYGESMGGAICFDGAILVAPTCKISDKVKPRWPIPQILIFLGKFFIYFSDCAY